MVPGGRILDRTLLRAGAFRRWQVLRTTRELREINDNFVHLLLCGQTALASFLVDDDFARRLVLLSEALDDLVPVRNAGAATTAITANGITSFSPKKPGPCLGDLLAL